MNYLKLNFSLAKIDTHFGLEQPADVLPNFFVHHDNKMVIDSNTDPRRKGIVSKITIKYQFAFFLLIPKTDPKIYCKMKDVKEGEDSRSCFKIYMGLSIRSDIEFAQRNKKQIKILTVKPMIFSLPCFFLLTHFVASYRKRVFVIVAC